MTRTGKLKIATLALAIAAGLGASGTVHAGLVATSVLEVTNFRITDAQGNPLDITDFGGAILQDSGTNTATLTGFAPVTNTLSIFGGGTMNILQSCVGAVCPGQDNFTHTTPPPVVGTQLARADSLLDGAPVTGIVGAPLGANARAVAEVLLTGNGIGGGDSDLNENTLFSFSLAQARTLRLSFDADLYLRTFLSADSKIGSSAAATSKLTFSLFDLGTGANLFSWAPNGAAGGIIGGTELLDGANLNDSITALIPGANFSRDLPGSQSFLAETTLGAGNYQFIVSHVVGADGTQVIPEPGTMLLAGVGLLGVALSRRRAKKVS